MKTPEQFGGGGEKRARTQIRRERLGYLTVEEGEHLVALAVETTGLRRAVEAVVVQMPQEPVDDRRRRRRRPVDDIATAAHSVYSAAELLLCTHALLAISNQDGP